MKKKKPAKKVEKSKIILPDNHIIIPGKEKRQVESISTMIQIPFVFNNNEKMDEIITRLDESFKAERVNTINAIGKLLGISVHWEQ